MFHQPGYLKKMTRRNAGDQHRGIEIGVGVILVVIGLRSCGSVPEFYDLRYVTEITLNDGI